MDSNNSDKLSLAVHECLSAAAQESRDVGRLVTGTFKVQPEVKVLTQKLCKQNGTDMSAFLRQCCLNLCKDYVDPAG